ncbi:MAG: FG-GAP repeat protein, partial [Planctomycetota bacterium]
ELIVGAPRSNINGVEDAGAIYVFGLGPLEDAPLRITAPTPELAWFGAEVRVADLDLDGRMDLAVGEPFIQDGTEDAGRVTLIYDFLGLAQTPQFVALPNPAPAENGKFGFHLALDDGNGDGFPELFVTAVGNTDSNGVELSGQAFGYWGPPQADGWFVLDDPLSKPEDFPRFGMFIDAKEGQVLVGAPRKDVESGPEPAAFCADTT